MTFKNGLRLCVLVLAGFTPCTAVSAQERYLDPIFSDIEVRTGIEYGVGRRGDGPDQPLLLDVYMPRNDAATNRPVIVLAFPGGFVSGSRDSSEMVRLAEQFAQRGYVAASIDYRLIDNAPRSTSDVEIAILRAVHDMRAAVRFFREDAAGNNEFGTDGDNIFVGGVSAGAVMAAVTGVLSAGDRLGDSVTEFLAANGGMAGNSSTNTEFSSRVSGVLQISGAIRRLSWIEPGDPPIYAAHEEFDPVVPCTTLPGIAFLEFGLAVTSSGACDIIPAAKAVGVATEFFLVKDSLAHVAFSVSELAQILNDAAAFFAREVLRPKTLASAVLPGSRSVPVGSTATLFASLVNATGTEARECEINPLTPLDAEFSYQPTDGANAPVGAVNSQVSIPPGAAQNFILSFAAAEAFDPTEVFFEFRCGDGPAADAIQGVNSVLLAANDLPVADVIGLTTVVDLVAPIGSTGLFAVGSANVGATEAVTVSVDDGGAGLPAQFLICETNSVTGVCDGEAASSVAVNYASASTRSFAVFANPSERIDENPATNRVFVRFRDAEGVIRGVTSSAIRTQ